MENPPNKTTGLQAWHPVPAAASHCDALSGRSPPPVPTWEQKISPWAEFRFWVFLGEKSFGASFFFNILWLGNVGNWRFDLFGLRWTGEAWGQLKVEVSGKSSHWHSNQRIREKKRENYRIQQGKLFIEKNNQEKKFNWKIIDKNRDCPNLPWVPLLTRAIR